jgi:hypothetical protein
MNNCGEMRTMSEIHAEEVSAIAVTETPVDQRAEFARLLRGSAPFFIGLFCYIVGYGLFLTFGLMALVGFSAGLTTLPTATNLPPAAPDRLIDQAQAILRVLAISGAILTLWPAWFCAYLVQARLQR